MANNFNQQQQQQFLSNQQQQQQLMQMQRTKIQPLMLLSSSSSDHLIPVPPPITATTTTTTTSQHLINNSNNNSFDLSKKIIRYDNLDLNCLIDSFLKSSASAASKVDISDDYESECFNEANYNDELRGDDDQNKKKKPHSASKFTIASLDFNHGLANNSQNSANNNKSSATAIVAKSPTKEQISSGKKQPPSLFSIKIENNSDCDATIKTAIKSESLFPILEYKQ